MAQTGVKELHPAMAALLKEAQEAPRADRPTMGAPGKGASGVHPAMAALLEGESAAGGMDQGGEFGQGAQTPLGYFSRALEVPGIVPWAGTKNARDLKGVPKWVSIIGALMDLFNKDKPLLQRLAKAGTAVASTPAAAETVDQAIEFVKGNTQALPGAKDVLFSPETQERHPFMTGAAGFAAEALTNPVNAAGFGAFGKGVVRGLNAATLAASGAELATQQVYNRAKGNTVSGVNTTLAALPIAAPLVSRFAPTRRVLEFLKGKNPDVPEALQRAAMEELVATPNQKWAQVKSALVELEQQVAKEGGDAAGRERLGKVMFVEGRREAARVARAAKRARDQAITESNPAPWDTVAPGAQLPKPNLRHLHAAGNQVGIDHDSLRRLAKEVYGVESLSDLDAARVDELAENLQAGRLTKDQMFLRQNRPPLEVETGPEYFRRAMDSGAPAPPASPATPAAPLTYADIRTGANARETYRQATDMLYDLAQQAQLPEFGRRVGYFHLSSEGQRVPFLQRFVEFLRTGRPNATPAAPPVASPHRGFMRSQISQTTKDYERSMAALGRKPVWDPVQSLTHRVQQQIGAEGALNFARRVAADPGIALPADKAPQDWVDLGMRLAKKKSDKAAQVFTGLMVEPQAAQYIENLLGRAGDSGVLLEGLDKYQDIYRGVTFFNPFDVVKRFGSQAAELGLTPGDIVRGAKEVAKPGFTGAKEDLLKAGVLRGMLPGAGALSTELAREAGTLPVVQKVFEKLPFVSPVANRKIEQGAADLMKVAAYTKLVQEGMAPEEAARLAGQAFGNPMLLQQMFGPAGSQWLRRAFFTPNWTLQNLGFQAERLANAPFRYFQLQRHLPNTVQRAITGTEMAENPAGRQERIALGPPNEEGMQPFLNPSLPTKDAAQVVNLVTFLRNRLHAVPNAVETIGNAMVQVDAQSRRAPLPPQLQGALEESRRVPAFGFGQQGLGPTVDPVVQQLANDLIPLAPDLAVSADRGTLGRDLGLELLGMFPSDFNTRAQARGRAGELQRAVAEVRANLRRRQRYLNQKEASGQ